MHTALSLPTVSPGLPAGRAPRRKTLRWGKTLRWETLGRLALGVAPLLLVATAGCGLPDVEGEGAVLPPSLLAPRPDDAKLCPATPEMSPNGLHIVGGDMVVDATCKKNPVSAWPLGANGRHILFANFEGVDVWGGGTPGNSFENIGLRAMDLMSKGVIALPPFDPDNPKRLDNILTIQKQVAAWYADFNVDVVISRPLSGDYLMTVVGGRQSDIVQMDGVVGISPGDCKNSLESNLNYAFSGSLSENVYQTAVTLAHECGHAYGLGHTQNSKDIMFPSVPNGGAKVDGFMEGEAADPGPCNFNMGDRQDGRKVLLTNLGPRQSPPPGGDAPSVAVLTPSDGASVGKDLTIAVKAEARQGIDHVTLSLSRLDGGKPRGAHPLAELRPPQSSAQVRITVAGSYVLIATAYDRAGNLAVSQVQLTVATPTCSVPNDCAPGQRCDNSTCVTPMLAAVPPTGMVTAANLRPWGTSCEETNECQGGVCASTPIGQICTHYCTADYLCAGGLTCTDGICMPLTYPQSKPKVGQLGGKCSRNQDCLTGDCSPATDATTPRYCTKECDPALGWTCPATMDCQLSDGASGMKNRCISKPTGVQGPAQGGCSFSGGESQAAGGGATLLVLAGLWLLGRRRRIDPAL